MEGQFNYVIARPWVEGEPQLCVYAYGVQVFFGSIGYARDMRDFINKRSEEKDYKIYTINPNPIE
jgi:hypothetical protein